MHGEPNCKVWGFGIQISWGHCELATPHLVWVGERRDVCSRGGGKEGLTCGGSAAVDEWREEERRAGEEEKGRMKTTARRTGARRRRGCCKDSCWWCWGIRVRP